MRKKCENCRFWSQMCAQSIGCGPIEALEALCLAGRGTKHGGRMMPASATCENWKLNSHGAMDEPPDYGEGARALYEAEESV